MGRADLRLDPSYRKVFEGLLSFSSLRDTEETIRRLEILCQQYRSASDKKGMEYCRQIAVLGRRRAELISRNKRVSPDRRLQKLEIATWFKIWLETPDLFWDWLSLRKNTEEFQALSKSESVREAKSGDRYASGSKTA